MVFSTTMRLWKTMRIGANRLPSSVSSRMLSESRSLPPKARGFRHLSVTSASPRIFGRKRMTAVTPISVIAQLGCHTGHSGKRLRPCGK
jgi:hypothetical protein